uniref:Uncharacterized protein n=1 Tax=Strongyloides papillosus TaxID=174720 RepID=A0A0N5B245_STREA
MRALIILIIYINISLSNSYNEYTNCILKVEGTPKCPPNEKQSVDLKIEYRSGGRSIASVKGSCNETMVVNANVSYESLTSNVYWARFYYFKPTKPDYYTRKIPEECINRLQAKGDHLYCNIGEIDPNNKTTSSNNKTPYIL